MGAEDGAADRRGIGKVIEIGEGPSALLVAFLTGGVVLNVLKEARREARAANRTWLPWISAEVFAKLVR